MRQQPQRGWADRYRSQRQALVPFGTAVVLAVLLSSSCAIYQPLPGAPRCPVTPSDAFWRARVANVPVHPSSSTWIASIGSTRSLKADFGSGLWNGGPIGIPYNIVPGDQPKVSVSFEYAGESDPGGYPIPPNPHIEGGPNSTGDRHILMVDKDNCRLYELYAAYPNGDGTWRAGSGAIWDMRSNAMRPAGWTSADAAGLQILPGLVRYDEVEAGQVLHAIRITVPTTHRSYVWPASHHAGSTSSTAYPPMGAWLRLKSSVNPDNYDPYVRPIIIALKTYGAVIADNGSAFYLSGVPDDRWDNDKLRALAAIKGSDFEFIDASSLRVQPGSYAATTAS